MIGLQRRFYPELTPLADRGSHLGTWGVDCFFVIIGFVITRAALSENWRLFVFSRVSRIYPVYWLHLVLTAVFVIVRQKETIGLDQLAASIFLLPGADRIVPVAWSLVFEVYF